MRGGSSRKLIPEGGSCDCPAAKGESGINETVKNTSNTVENAAESVKSEATEAVQEVKEVVSDTINEIKSDDFETAQKVEAVAGEAVEKIPGKTKNNKGLAYIVVGIIVALFIFLIFAMCSSGGSTSAVKKYIKSVCEKNKVYVEALKACLYAAWVHDDMNEDNEATECRRAAIKIYDSHKAVLSEDHDIALLCADILRRSGDFERVVREYKGKFLGSGE